MKLEEVSQDMAREYIENHPGATVEEVAGWISACGCMGCPQWKSPEFNCPCGMKCRCRCTLEPIASQNAARWQWYLGQARLAIQMGRGQMTGITEKAKAVLV